MEENTLARIYKSSLKFLVPLSTEETYSIVVDEAVKLIGGEDGVVLLGEKSGLSKIYASSPSTHALPIRKRGYAYNCFKKQQAFVVQQANLYKTHPFVKKEGVRSVIFIPLSYRNKAVGVLAVRARENCLFTQKELDILQLYGAMASLGIRKVQLHDEMVEALEMRDLFMSMAAHELRTPITTIYGYAQLLENKFKDHGSNEARWVGEMCRESGRLNLLVNDLLEINRIRAGRSQYVWKECSLKEIVEQATRDVQFSFSDHQLAVEDGLRPGHDLIIADQNKLLQVVINILDNACKFSPANTKIHVGLSSLKSILILKIEDRGSGISRRDLPRVFEGFYRGRDPDREGMGLGLYLSKNIIDEHHGSIRLRSKLNFGTTVEIRLPRART